MLVTHLNFPGLDRLLGRFKEDSKPFFASLKSAQRKELRKYINYKKAVNPDSWSFSPFTAATLSQLNYQAEKFYLHHLRYTQLKIPQMEEVLIQQPTKSNRFSST